MARFFLKDGQYFETLTDVPPADGAMPVPQRPAPHWQWDGQGWIEGQISPPPPAVLDPARFEYMLALTGFGDVWDALEQAARDGGDMVTFAALRAERRRKSFYQDVTLAVVAQFRRQAAQIAPGVDLSDDAIKAAWEQAAQWGGLGNG